MALWSQGSNRGGGNGTIFPEIRHHLSVVFDIKLKINDTIGKTNYICLSGPVSEKYFSSYEEIYLLCPRLLWHVFCENLTVCNVDADASVIGLCVDASVIGLCVDASVTGVSANPLVTEDSVDASVDSGTDVVA